jgi:hypothetical protein
MTDGHQCDRCGEFEADDDVYSVPNEISTGYNTVADDGTVRQCTCQYDLCNDCRKALVDWVEVTER